MQRLLQLLPLLLCLGCRTPAHSSNPLDSALAAGRAHHLPYIIQSATILVEIEDTPAEKPVHRRTTYRYIYTLRPLRNIALKDDTFAEFLDNKVGERMDYWQGSEPQRMEVAKPNAKGFQVQFAAPADGIRTVVTGMTIYENLPLKGRRQIRSFDFSPNEFSVFYPNKEDYIAELIIVVSSATTSLKAAPAAAWRMAQDAAPAVSAPATLYPKHPPEWNGTTLSTRFENLKPGETVGLRYAW